MATRSTTAPSKPSRRRLRSVQQRCSGWIDRARYLLEEALKTAPDGDAGYDAAALEDRILLSATPIVQAVADGGLDAAVDAPLTFAPEVQTPLQQRRELVVIDSAAANYHQLVDDLESQDDRQLEVIVLDGDRDGIEQISRWLSEHEDVDAIHIVSHAEDGAMRLGSGWLNTDNLAAYSSSLSGWADSLSGDADLLLYGCDLAASETGRELLESLQALTGADVAASHDDTGHAQFSANWDLEYSIGQIDSSVAFSEQLQTDWLGKLAVITVDTTDDVIDVGDGLTSLREAIIAVNGGSGGDTIVLGAGVYQLTIGSDGENSSLEGDLDIRQSVTISGAGAQATIIDGGGIDRVLHIHENATVATISGVTIRGGVETDQGGGVFVDDASTLNLSDAIVTGNVLGNGRGGGLFVQGHLRLERVLVSDNTAKDGGGIYFDGSQSGVLTNVTISGNTATEEGGGIWSDEVITVMNSTIAFNTAPSGGGVFDKTGSEVTITNTILHNPIAPNANQALLSGGNNIDSDGSAVLGAGDQIGVDPLLAPTLTLSQGQIPTHALQTGSPAINAGAAAGAPATDARGVARDSSPDVGAYETYYELLSTDEFRVNSATGNTQETSQEGRGSQQAVAIDAEGDYVVVWSSSNQDGSGWGIYAQLYDQHGAARGGELLINSGDTNYDQKWATVGMDAAGNFVVAWTDFGLLGDSDIFARRFDADGNALGGIFQVNDASLNNRSGPSIAMADDGRFVIAWKGGDALTDEDIFARRFDATGAALDGSDIVVEGAAGGDYDAAVAINNSGEFAVLWDDPGGVKLQRFNANGTTNGGQITVDGSSNAGNGSLAMHSDGSLVVTWREGVSGSRDVRVRHYDNTGSAVAPASTVATSTAGEQTDPSIAMDSVGNYVIVWEGGGDQAGHSDTSGVFGQKYDATGSKVGDEFRINQTTTGTQHLTSAAMLNIDNFVVVWSGNGDQAGHIDSSGVFVRQYGTLVVNQLPTADAGGAYTINEGQGLILSAAGSSDPDGDTLSYQWDLDNDGQFGEVGEPTGVGATVSWATLQSFGIDDNGSYTIGVRVDDGRGGVHSATTTLTVNEVAPVLNVGGAVSGTENTVYSLSLSATDPGDDAITQWIVDWGDGTTTTHNFDAGTATHTYTRDGNFSILVAATDEDGTHVQRELLVAAYEAGQDTVYRFDAASGQLASTLGSSGGQLLRPVQALVGKNGDIYVSGFDSDNIVRYDSAGNYLGEFVTSGSGGLDGACGMVFDADGNLYVASFNTNQILRYDASGNFVDVFGSGGAGLNGPTGIVFGPDGDLYVSGWSNGKIYRYDGINGSPTVVVSNGLSNPDQIAFNGAGDLLIANGMNNTVQIYDGSLSTFASGLNNATGIALSPEGILYVSNRADGSVVMRDATTGASLGTLVTAGTGGLSNTYHLNWIPDHQVQIAAAANTAATVSLTNVVSPINENTSTAGGLKVADIVITDDGNGINTLALSGADASAFEIDGLELKLKASVSLDYEIKSSYDVSVSVDDPLVPGSPDSTVAVTILIQDVDEFNISAISDANASSNGVDENVSLGTTVGITASASDADATNNTISYTLINDAQGRFTINAATGVVTVSGLLDAEHALEHTIVVRAFSSDGSFVTNPFTIAVNDVNEWNVSPIVDLNGNSNTVAENAAPGTAVGITASATDADATNHTVSYSLDDDAGGRFSIHSSSGVVTVAGMLDAEAATSHTIVVRATSSDGSTTTQSFTIAVDNVNDNLPVFTSSGTVSIVENQTVVQTLSASDADVPAQTISFVLSGGDDAGRFTIHGANQLVFVATPDFEAPSDSNADNVYEVEVTAHDGAGGTTTQTLAVTVTDENEGPSITAVADQTLDEDQSSGPLTFTIGDSETNASGLLVTASSSNPAVVGSGGITLSGSGAQRTVTVVPEANQSGSSVVTLTVSDGTLSRDTSFVVNVTSVNDAPTIQPIGDPSTFEDQPGTVSIVIGDVDDPVGSLMLSASSDNPGLITDGSLVLTGSGANRTLSFQPVANQFGSATITVSVSDGTVVTNQSFVVVVQSVNDAPTATPAATSLTTAEDTPVSISVLPWFEDIDDAVLNYQALPTDPSQLTARMVGDQLQIQPREDWHGTTTVRVKAIDAAGAFVIRNVSVTVTSVNDVPVGRTDRIVVLDESVTFSAADLMANDTDVDGDTLTLEIVSPPERGTLVDLGGGRFEYQPDGNGDVSMTYRLFDGTVYSDPVSVHFSVPQIPVTPAAVPAVHEAPAEVANEPSEASQDTAPEEPAGEPAADKPAITSMPTVPTAPPVTVRPAGIDAGVGLAAAVQNQGQGFTWTLRTESLMDVVAEATERVLGDDTTTTTREEIKAAYATAAAQIRDAITQPQMWQAIHSMQDQIDSSVSTTTLTIGATVTATTSITVGYVVWVIRGGILLSSVMANLPMWRLMDPMAILNAVDGAEEDDESLESMVDEAPPAEPVGADV